MPIKLIVGLGNPGIKYKFNRHNVGFNAVDLLAREFDANWRTQRKFFAVTTKIIVNQSLVILAKPNTYVNQSGKSIMSFVNFTNIIAENILIVHDELDLSLGTTKLKFGGGHGGHNGLKNISAMLGSNYYRLRIGIGRPIDNITDFVLSDSDPSEKKILSNSYLKLLQNIEVVINKTDHAMQYINTK